MYFVNFWKTKNCTYPTGLYNFVASRTYWHQIAFEIMLLPILIWERDTFKYTCHTTLTPHLAQIFIPFTQSFSIDFFLCDGTFQSFHSLLFFRQQMFHFLRCIGLSFQKCLRCSFLYPFLVFFSTSIQLIRDKVYYLVKRN